MNIQNYISKRVQDIEITIIKQMPLKVISNSVDLWFDI
jgi:hypothetical protein